MTPYPIQVARHTDTSDPLACWRWGGSIDRYGYGRFGKGGVAHRAAYEQVHGPIPSGLSIDHLCRVRDCVNPAHMEAVPPAINSLRGFGVPARNARKTHCDNGHEFNEVNTRVENGVRRCRPCQRVRSAAYKARKRAVA